MAKRIALQNLNASTYDILNAIRNNASAEYTSLIPEVSDVEGLKKIGDVFYGYPALANQFITALVNRIALVRVKGALFNNMYADLKKGYLEYGETVEEVFVGIAKAREFSVEKAEAREFKRTLPDVRTAFHMINYRAQYPVTIQNEDLRMAFMSMGGVQDLIAKIVDQVYTGAEYDEYLLFKYLLIKAIAHGKAYPVKIDSTDPKATAKAFRGYSNKLMFMSDKYNDAGVHTVTGRDAQNIFMDAEYNATFDVEVLASAFNMDKATFMGRLRLIDDWTTFDNARFDEIRANSDNLEVVTEDELALMAHIKGVLVDTEWFQFYDNLTNFTEKYVASGIYWNYFLNVWKTVSYSPFSNIVVFVDDTANITMPETVTVEVQTVSVGDAGHTVALVVDEDTPALHDAQFTFVQTQDAVEKGIAVFKYGGYMFPANAGGTKVQITADGVTYTSASNLDPTTVKVGDTIALTKE